VKLAAPEAPRLKQVTLRPAADIASVAVLGVGLLLSETVFKRFLIPDGCRWCETNAYDLWLSGVRAPLAAQPAIDLLSTVTVITAPALAMGANLFLALYGGSTFGDVLWDLLIVMQATLSAMALQATVKFMFGRERPLAYRLSGADKNTTAHPEDNNVSFFSGHTAFAFAAVTAAGTLARLRGFKHPWLAWVLGFPFAALTGFLRMAADKHWFSDVLIGAAAGAATGWFIPTFFHPREGEEGQPPRVTLAPMPLGLAVSVRLD
jgi:membrane-associated phospholipid phosphatase